MIGKQYYINNLPKTWLHGIPFTLIRIKDGVFTFFKESGYTEVRLDLSKEQFKLYEITL